MSTVKDKVPVALNNSFTSQEPVQTIEKLLKNCKCSMRTLRRKIKKSHIICSYNKNSMFYTMPSLAEFNQYGVWKHEEASFSKWGNLFETIIHLADHSKTGYTSNELGEILRVKIYDALRVLSKEGRIKKLQIQSKNVYVSSKADIASGQIKKRNIQIEKKLVKKKYPLPKPDIIIAILVEIIVDRKAASQKIGKNLKKKKIIVNPSEIETVIEHYQLKKKLSNKSD